MKTSPIPDNLRMFDSQVAAPMPKKPTARPPKKRVKTKVKLTINLPEKVIKMGMEWAESNGRSLSSLLEDLLRRELERKGITVDLSPAEFAEVMRRKFGPGFKTATGDNMPISEGE